MRLFALPPALFLLISRTLASEASKTTTSSVTLTTTTFIASTTITLTLSRNVVTRSSKPTATERISPSQPKMSNFQSTILNSTNTYRSIYQASPLTWNSTLASFAANHAKSCVFQHSGGPYGENLAAGYASPTLAISAWANEESHYNYATKKFSEKNGHFTQLVWQATTQVGCANVACQGGVEGEYLVCEYFPRGNVQGEFGENVRKAGMSAGGELGIGSGAEGRRVGWWREVVVGLVVCWAVLR